MAKEVDAKKATRTKLIWGGIVAAVIVIAFVSMASSGGQYEQFAKCTADKGAQMYGAFWCPACAQQKQAFGADWKHVKYVECSNQDRSQTEVCAAAGIRSYPTWKFADGTERGGVISLEQLAQITGCSLTAQ